jgi:hypothetical protein
MLCLIEDVVAHCGSGGSWDVVAHCGCGGSWDVVAHCGCGGSVGMRLLR